MLRAMPVEAPSGFGKLLRARRMPPASHGEACPAVCQWVPSGSRDSDRTPAACKRSGFKFPPSQLQLLMAVGGCELEVV